MSECKHKKFLLNTTQVKPGAFQFDCPWCPEEPKKLWEKLQEQNVFCYDGEGLKPHWELCANTAIDEVLKVVDEWKTESFPQWGLKYLKEELKQRLEQMR